MNPWWLLATFILAGTVGTLVTLAWCGLFKRRRRKRVNVSVRVPLAHVEGWTSKETFLRELVMPPLPKKEWRYDPSGPFFTRAQDRRLHRRAIQYVVGARHQPAGV